MPPRTKFGLAALTALGLFGCGVSRSAAPDAAPAAVLVPDASTVQSSHRAYDDILLDASPVAARRAEPIAARPAEPWEKVADQREGVRFELPAQPLRVEAGYSLSQMGTTYEVDFEDVPDSLLSGGRVPDRFIAEWARAHGGLATIKRSGSQSGVETRDFVMQRNGSMNEYRAFWRPERRRMIVVGVSGHQANADRFLDSVTFF